MKLPSDYGPEDFLGWLRNPITQAFLQGLDADRLMLMELWAKKRFVGENADQSLFLNAEALAKVATIDEILLNLEESEAEAQKEIKRRQQEK
jgi:hypothetical protein